MAQAARQVHLCSATNDLALCVWSFPMADFVPALSLYVLTAAVSIVTALSWVA
jgi:hypothetical protein